MIYLVIALGGAIGSIARYWLSTLVDTRIGDAFPWGTLLVNITGCLLIGLIAALPEPQGRLSLTLESRFFLMTGVCGGFTTFSTFSLQTLSLMKAGDWTRALAYISASVILCMLGVWLGSASAGLLSSQRTG